MSEVWPTVKADLLSAQVEIEIYTWDVLSKHLKTGNIVDYVVNDWSGSKPNFPMRRLPNGPEDRRTPSACDRVEFRDWLRHSPRRWRAKAQT